MDFECLHDKAHLRRYLERDPYLHIYELGDLDDFFWPRTTWYGRRATHPSDRETTGTGGNACSDTGPADLEAVALVYAGPELPTLIALGPDPRPLIALLRSIHAVLAERFYAHLSPAVEGALEGVFHLGGGADHLKMALRDASSLGEIETTGIEPLFPRHAYELGALYEENYPENWFDERMLETRQYYGIRVDGRLVSAAGIHVYSKSEKVAALGNIVTDTACRGRGFGRRVTVAVCRSLLADGVRIGLNVRADNRPAIAIYEQLGFRVEGRYREFEVSRRANLPAWPEPS